MTLVDVMDGPAVGNDIALEAPLVPQSAEEEMIRAGRFAADGIVGAHHGVGVALHDRGAKRGSVRVRKIMRRDGHIFAMAQRFRAAVNGKVLGSGNDLQVFGIVALQTGYKSHSNPAREERIFAVSFLASAPARIAKDIDVGRPKGEAVVAAGISVLYSIVVLGARFGRDDVGHAVNEVGVPRGGEADGLRENSGMTGASDAVQAFVPPIVGGNTKARDGAGNVLHLRSLFFQRHARNQVVDALLHRKTRIQIGWTRSGGCGRVRSRLSGNGRRVEKQKK